MRGVWLVRTKNLLISTEIVESEHGDRNKRGIYVDFMVGIPIDIERLVVQ